MLEEKSKIEKRFDNLFYVSAFWSVFMLVIYWFTDDKILFDIGLIFVPVSFLCKSISMSFEGARIRKEIKNRIESLERIIKSMDQ